MAEEGKWFGFVEMAPAAAARLKGPPGAPPENVGVTMRVAGGPPDQKYRFTFSMGLDGSAHCKWEGVGVETSAPALAGPPKPEGEVTLAAPNLRQQSVEVATKAVSVPMSPPAFPPDSIIGQLQVATPEGQVRTFFMADPEQAKTAGLTPPEEIRRLAESIYKVCEEAAHVPKLRP